MDMSGSQKALKVISIIDIVFGVIAIIVSFIAIFMGGAIGIATSEVASAELSAEEMALASGAMSIIGVLGIIMGIVTLVEGILGLRASNDPSKIMPVWILALIGVAGNAVSLIMTLVQGGNIFSAILSLVVSGLMFWVANNIKVQAGK
ncbi:MAG: hypothetical protein Q4A07_06420 [Coriobacteriales bacterium]|nr:hypothetical protein [Coriobacteriales bacterium]